MTVLLHKILSPYNWQEFRHEPNERHYCFTPSQFNEFLYSRYYYAGDTLYRTQHAKYDCKTYQINELKQRNSKRSVPITETIQQRINERTESNASSNLTQSQIVIERKNNRKMCIPPSFWDQSKLRSVSEQGSSRKPQEIGIVRRTRKRKQCMIPQIKETQKHSHLNMRLNTIEEDCFKE